MIEKESKFLYFGSHQRYNTTPETPDITIGFDNGEVIINIYSWLLKKDHSRYFFNNGILMKREFFDTRTETYTVSSGIGEIIVTDPDGLVIERRFLERKVNNAGYLEYEAVKFPSGTGYEYFFTKNTFE